LNTKLSMKDIAAKIGVSTATISRVINNKGGYSKETEKKVLEAIEKLEYVPDAYAKSLRTNSSHAIGVVVPDITNEFFAEIARVIDTFFLKHKYSVFICDTNESKEKEDIHIRHLIEKKVDGVIYISGQTDAESFIKKNIPVVYIDRRPRHADILIQSDNENGGYLATKELIEKGCKKILLLRDSRTVSTIINRRKGYLKALKENNLIYDSKYEIGVFPCYEEALNKITDLVKSGFDFDGVFATNDNMALGVVHGLNIQGLRVPEDVKVVGFDNVSLSKFCNPPLTTITQNTEKLGIAASEILMELINNGKIVDKNIIIPVTIEKRNST